MKSPLTRSLRKQTPISKKGDNIFDSLKIKIYTYEMSMTQNLVANTNDDMRITYDR
jgi:hypothetical protein